VDRALERLGKKRRIAVLTHTFLSAPLIVASTDHILTGPSRVLVPMASRVDLRLLAPPVELANFSVHAGWHPRMQNDPVHAWIRGLLKEEAAKTSRVATAYKSSGRGRKHRAR
jgi:DNA-binding transcriptional LysR family regulator